MVSTPTAPSRSIWMCRMPASFSRSAASARPRAPPAGAGRSRCRASPARPLGDRLADDRRVAAQRVAAQRVEHARRRARGARRAPPCPRWRRAADRCRAARRPRAPRRGSAAAPRRAITPTPLFSAISCSALARPPRVGSFIAVTASPGASARAHQAVDGRDVGLQRAVELELVARRQDGEARGRRSCR